MDKVLQTFTSTQERFILVVSRSDKCKIVSILLVLSVGVITLLIATLEIMKKDGSFSLFNAREVIFWSDTDIVSMTPNFV